MKVYVMSTWSVRIKLRMKELELTQEILAQKMGITRGAITHYLAGRRVPPLRQFQKLAAVLKVDPAWLQFGTSSTSNTKQNNKKTNSKSEQKELSHNRIPILSFEQISDFIITTKLKQDEVKEYLPSFYANQKHWYALRIKGDTMTTPSGNLKSFHEGDIIIVDSEKKAVHGSYVIALLPKSKEATFKQYVIDGGVKYLKPLNPQYPIVEINDSTHICGVIVNCVSEFII